MPDNYKVLKKRTLMNRSTARRPPFFVVATPTFNANKNSLRVLFRFAVWM
jgi:hypothetical protein